VQRATLDEMRKGLRAAGLTVAALAATAALPAVAAAAALRTDRGCYTRNQTVWVTGSGFTPSVRHPVTLDGRPFGGLTADALGRVDGYFAAPRPLTARTSRRVVRLGMTDGADPATTAAVAFRVVHTDVSITPKQVTPGLVNYSALGFTSGRDLYIHYVRRGRYQRTVKLGRLSGACHTLRTRAAMFPFRPVRSGVWRLIFNTRRRYSPDYRPSFSFDAPVTVTFY
jgi:hypothetical protein